MTDRTYTVKEIDDLRLLCRNKVTKGKFFPPMDPHSHATWVDGKPYLASRQILHPTTGEGAEELLRSYLIAGITADDIREQCADEIEEQKRSADAWLATEKARESGFPVHGDMMRNATTNELTHIFHQGKWLEIPKDTP